jgi:hypothetical protein
MNTYQIRLLSVSYLLLATLLFISNWFYLKYGLIFLTGHILYFVYYSVSTKKEKETNIAGRSLIYLAIISLVWTLIMGVGGVFLQTTDFIAHNTKFYELYANEWPIIFKEKQSFSCYYYGYYLVPAFLFKLFDHLSVLIIIAYTWLGIWLGLVWMYLLLFRNIWLVGVLIMSGGIIFSLETLSLGLFHKSFSYNPLFSLFIQSLYVPNQIISSLLTTGIFIFYIKNYRISFYAITLSFYWGVFPAFLLMILFGTIFIYDYLKNKGVISIKSFLYHYIFPSFLFLPSFIFLTSSNEMPVHGFYIFNSISSLIPYIDVLLMAIITIWLTRSKNSRDQHEQIPSHVIIPALLILALTLTYHIGIFNDLYLRGSIPLYLILLINMLQRLHSKFSMDYAVRNFSAYMPFFRKYAVILVWIGMGLFASFFQLGRSLKYNILVANYTPLPYQTFPNSYQALLKYYGQEGANQYVGNPQSFYYLYLAPRTDQQIKF